MPIPRHGMVVGTHRSRASVRVLGELRPPGPDYITCPPYYTTLHVLHRPAFLAGLFYKLALRPTNL